MIFWKISGVKGYFATKAKMLLHCLNIYLELCFYLSECLEDEFFPGGGISTRQRLTISPKLCIFHVGGMCSESHCFHVLKSNNRKHTSIPTLSQL